VLEGTADRDLMAAVLQGARDRKGLSPALWATLQAAVEIDRATAMLAELTAPPQPKEESQLDQVVKLLESIAEAQSRMERRQVGVESKLDALLASSRAPSRLGPTGSRA
jgi:hypothetical protein